MSKNKLSKCSCLMVLLFPAALIQAACLDVITPVGQPKSNVCWAACADMILTYYGNQPNLNGIWTRGTNKKNIVNGLCDYPHPDDLKNIKDILGSGNPVRNIPLQGNTCQGGVVLWNDLQTLLCDATPIIAGLSDDNLAHVVLVVGWKNNGMVTFIDPKTGTQIDRFYDAFFENDNWYWVESAVPANGSPVGLVPVAEPQIWINSGPTQFAYPGSNATYTGSFYCPPVQTCMPPWQWNWSLSFFHNSGNYTVASLQDLQGVVASTWNVPAFTLPSTGYEWHYTADGQIRGMVSVSTEGYSDWKNVTYVPQNQIPWYVNFNDQTVSGQHADVAAHHCIDINNVTMNYSAAITFKAGNYITINDLTTQYGANVTMQVDPALQ